MKKYNVYIVTTIFNLVEVDADSTKLAEEKVESMLKNKRPNYNNGYVLDSWLCAFDGYNNKKE